METTTLHKPLPEEVGTISSKPAAVPGERGVLSGSITATSTDDAKRARSGRLKWQSRRALLELDIVLQRFWARQGEYLDDDLVDSLTRLLELEDYKLWSLVSGQVETTDADLGRFVEMLRGMEADISGININQPEMIGVST